MAELNLLKDQQLAGKIALVRVDHNVVKKGKIIDPFRIDASLPTLRLLLNKGARIVLMSHVGRPRDKKTGEINISPESSCDPVIAYLQDAGFKTAALPLPPHAGFGIPSLTPGKELADLKARKFEILYLPNTRWFSGEEADAEAKARFGKELASYGDLFVNDAFGSWQPHASTIEPAKHLPACAGLLMEKEIENLNAVLEPQRPFLAVIAGSKFDTKIEPLYALLEKADHLVLGGVIYNAFLSAKYGIKIKGVSEADLEIARDFVKFSLKFKNRILILNNIVESDLLDSRSSSSSRSHNIYSLGRNDSLNYVLDIDPSSFQNKAVQRYFDKARTIFVNAVMGLTPLFNEGTIALNQQIAANIFAKKLFGGGDTLQELKTLTPQIYEDALRDDDYYFFTGGGTILKAISENSPYGLEPVKMLLKK